MYQAAIRAIPNNFHTLSTLNRGDGEAVSIFLQGKKGLCHDILYLIVGKSKGLDNQGIIAQVKRAFKSYSFFSTKKNNEKADNLCIKFVSTPLEVCTDTSISYFNNNVPFFCCHLFRRISEFAGQSQRNGKQTVDYHPNPSELSSKIHSLLFL